VKAEPDRYELHFEDETHVETNPCLGSIWHRVGQQPVIPAAGTNRRLTVFGSVEAAGRGRVEVLSARADSIGFGRYLAVLDARHAETHRDIILVLDNGSCHTSKVTRQALAERKEWLEVVPLSRYSPQLNPKEREWRVLKRDHRSHLAPTLRAFADDLLAGLGQLGGERCDVVDDVPDWWLAGHRKEPTGRPLGRPRAATDAVPRKPHQTNLPAPT
jgi:hypothetical protein